MADPRTTIRYQRAVELIDLLNTSGPLTVEDICDIQGWSFQQFKDIRYGMAGRLALEDHDVTIPRPVAAEGYVYKLASAYRTGVVDEDGEPNIQAASGDMLTRVATIYADVERLIDATPARSAVRKMLRKFQKSLDGTLDRAEDVAVETGAPVSSWAQHILDRIA